MTGWIRPGTYHEDDLPLGLPIKRLRHLDEPDCERILLRDAIRRAMWSLDTYEIEMILDRFNLYDMGTMDKPMNQKLIARHWRLPAGHVGFILNNALETMRQSLVAAGLTRMDFV